MSTNHGGGSAEEVRVLILGAGFAGIGAAIRLQQAGERDFLVLERAERLGGAWRDNVYPGCRCDVPSNLYSFSFAPNPDWTRTYADQAEIWSYLEATAERFGILPNVRFAHRVSGARWNGHDRWLVETDRGCFSSQFLIGATGSLAEPRMPDIPGITTFDGPVLHSARWNPPGHLDGRRVAVIGTGASAVQIIPAIQPEVSHLDVFQRTPGWVLPHPVQDVPKWQRRLFRVFPPAQRVVRAAIYFQRELILVPAFTRYDGIRSALERRGRRHLRNQVADPELRQKLEPQYQLGCKRVLPSNDFYPALCQPNVELVTESISRIEPGGLLTADGRLHAADMIVLATGFAVSDNPMANTVVGRDGHRLSEAFEGDLAHHLGTTFPNFPNFFMLTGPNTGTGHSSQIFMIECQLAYVIDALTRLNGDNLVVEVLPSVAEASVAEVEGRLRKSVWSSGCSSWYQNGNGRNVAIWPDFTVSFRRRTRRFDADSFVIGRPASASGGPDGRAQPPTGANA